MTFSTPASFQRVVAITKFHFISGLPCSDASALTAVLDQNPRFSARSNSLAAEISAELLTSCATSASVLSRLPKDQRSALLRSVLDAVYIARPLDGVVFDNSLDWMMRIDEIAPIFPLSRFIFVVRDPVEIVAQLSRERDVPAKQQPGFAHDCVREDGEIGAPLSAIRTALAGPFADRVILIERTHLLSDPEGVVAALYDFLQEPEFSHEFNALTSLKPDPPLIRRNLRQIFRSRPMQGWRAGRSFAPVWRQMSRSPASLLLAKTV